MLGDNLNMILTEGPWCLLNDYCELDIIEGGNSKISERTYRTVVSGFLDENPCPLHIDRLTFNRFSIISSWGVKNKVSRTEYSIIQ